MADNLDSDIRDQLVAIARGTANLVPFVGGPLGEVISQVVPRQRQDRIVTYLRQLAEKLETLEKSIAKEALSDIGKVDLIETGGYQAARATTRERISTIAEVVFNGIKRESAETIRRKRLLDIFGQIDDDEAMLLNAYGQSYGASNSNVWDTINRPPPAHLGSPKQDVDQEKLFELGRERLLRLGLLERKFGLVKKGEYPEFDARTGGFKGHIQISYLGRMLLRDMGAPSPFDRER